MDIPNGVPLLKTENYVDIFFDGYITTNCGDDPNSVITDEFIENPTTTSPIDYLLYFVIIIILLIAIFITIIALAWFIVQNL